MSEAVAPPSYRVVVGVSARTGSPTALRWAADLAAERGGSLLAVRTWRPMNSGAGSRGTPSAVSPDAEAAAQAAQDQLAADVARTLGSDHAADVRLLVGTKRRGLLSASEGADLLVIDAPRRIEVIEGPGFVQRLVQAAHCPVVVIPRAMSGEPARPSRAAGFVRGVSDAAGRAPRAGLGHLRPETVTEED